MAVLDSDAGEIVIRVVYDGPPEAGKTTSLRALAGSLAQSTYSPEEDAGGRTLWFDWMEYTGGRFEGYRIRCQIVSVPGQTALSARRRHLLAGADVVVFVGDSSRAGWDLSLAYLGELRGVLADLPGPPIGVVVQANKRDLPGALGLDELRGRLGDERWSIGLIESVAAEGTGIREGFVYAVRLALDRVREQMQRRTLPSGPPELASPAQLLDQLRAGEARPLAAPLVVESGPDSLAASLLREVLAGEAEAAAGRPMRASRGAPRPPDATVPSGAIWPPVEGRAILYEVSQLGLAPRQLGNGDWAAGLGSGWRVVSRRDASYPGIDQGRTALIKWARLHAASQPAISPRRCIVLADAGDGCWRLWQIVRAEDSLRELVGRALEERSAEQVVYRLCQAAQLLLDADGKLAGAPCALPCSIDSVGGPDGAAVFIGLMPDADGATDPAPERVAGPALLRSQLGPVVQGGLAERRADLTGVLARVPRQFVHSEAILTTLAGLLS